ncbi:MAG: type II toxin-antitoxin system Phd/YefM family antitoxin [Armatimonadetes bacterium]|nr:type II toxin-antitoxin system Phd/YefM family antitoxin [Armatimonadota bacterium]
MTVNMHEAKTHLSRLVAAALAGEEVILARGGKELVRLVALESPTLVRKAGCHPIVEGPDFVERSMAPLTEEDLKDWGL